MGSVCWTCFLYGFYYISESDVFHQKQASCYTSIVDKSRDRIYKMSFATVYPLYIAKVERKGRTKEELDQTVLWLTGYSQKDLEKQIKDKVNFETFFNKAPQLNPLRNQIKGVICGVRVEEIKDPVVQSVRYMDKLVDELAKGRPVEKILRK